MHSFQVRAVSGVVAVDEAGRVLLVRRADDSTGARVHFVGVVFTAAAAFGGGVTDDEAVDVQFFPLGALPEPLFGPDRPVLADLVSGRNTPVIG